MAKKKLPPKPKKKAPTIRLTKNIFQGPHYRHCLIGTDHEIVDPPEDTHEANQNGGNGFWIMSAGEFNEKGKRPILIYHGEYE